MPQPANAFHSVFWTCLFKSLLVGLAAVLLVLIGILVVGNTSVAHAGEELVKVNEMQQGSLLFKSDHRGLYRLAPKLNTDVEMDITAMTARVRVSQTFHNQGQDWVEGIYVYPLPENAAVDHMRMKIGERIIEGQIKERKEAKKIYKAAKNAGKKAALIEQERPNIFTNSVANIGPGETIVIEIEYQQTLRYDTDTFSIRFPMVVAPRFIPGSVVNTEYLHEAIEETLTTPSTSEPGMGWAMNTDQVPDASRITPPVILETEEKLNPVTITVRLNAGIDLVDIRSLYHKVNIEKSERGRATIRLHEKSVPADRDFVLEWQPTPSAAPRAAVFTESLDNNHYGLIMIMPPVIEQGTQPRLPREVTFIIDTSGSMGGESIRQARAALEMAVRRLTSSDRFNIIEFNSSMHSLYGSPVEASAYNKQQAIRFVQGLDAGGGTVMEPALRAALRTPENSAFIQQIVFLTDGSVGNESALFHLIETNLGNKRLFTIGIGSAPNSHFMSRAAKFGRGTFSYIGKLSEVSEKMQALFRKLETPAMSHLQIEWPGDAGNIDYYPKRLPDLYAGEPLLITATMDAVTGQIKINGQRGQQPWSATLPVHSQSPQPGVGVLWARNRIADLMDQIHAGGSKQEIRPKVIATALAHHLVSKYTSLVAVDVTPTRPIDKDLMKGAVPSNLPKGWDRSKVFGAAMPKTATSAQLHQIIGVMFLLLALTMIYGRGLNRGNSGRCSSHRAPVSG